MKPTEQDKTEFRAFCENATTRQLKNIFEKERDAARRDPDGRRAYEDIAWEVLDARVWSHYHNI